MRYGILGPLRVGDAAGDTAVTAGRDRVLLAMLLLHAGRPVTLARLVEAMWDDNPPATARGQVHTCVSRLRRSLQAAGATEELITHPAGYQLDVAPVDVDAAEFDRLVGRARALVERGEPAPARDVYQSALALWRGPALDGISSRVVRGAAAALDERRFAAIEDRIDVELLLGQERGLIGELTELVERHPLRERLRGQLMTALWRDDRRADALAAFRRGREILAEELGIEPGPPLQELHQRILSGESAFVAVLAPSTSVPSAASPASSASTPPSPPPAPAPAGPPAVRSLPRAVPDFTGRAESVEFLLAGAAEAEYGPVVQLVDGMAGSGKTALAVHVAHRLAARHPDAQLFIDLYGHSERGPLDPSAALLTLLRQLGVPTERIPADLEERISLWRTELSGRRAVVVLDNAASSAQVAPLLPTAAGTVALVTSRRRLLGLDGVRPRSLPLLDPEEAAALLARIVGQERVTAEPAASTEVVRRCGYLPLAIRLAGSRLAHRPGWRVAHLAERLSDDRPLLPELAAEDRTVAGAFGLSYAHLDPAQRRMFRLLGVHPGEWLDDHAAAALVDLPLGDTRELLAELIDRHLVEEPDAGRYRLHDLIREYAATLAATDAEGVGAPLERLLDYYLSAVRAAADEIATPIGRAVVADRKPSRPDLTGGPAAAGVDWLERERPHLTRVVRAAGQAGLHELAWRLARACFRFLSLCGYRDDTVDLLRLGLASAEAVGDRAAVALLHNYLGGAYVVTGQPAAAEHHLRAAIALREADGLATSAAVSRGNLAGLYAVMGRFPEAEAECDLALAVVRRRGDLAQLQHVVQAQAEVYRLGGRFADALRVSRTDLGLSRQLRAQAFVGTALGNIGALRFRLGEIDAADRLLSAALGVKRRADNRYGEAETMNDLATVRRAQGRTDEALAMHEQALAIMREVGNRHGECLVMNDFAVTLRIAGKVDRAAALHREVVLAAGRSDFPYRLADAYVGLAECLAGRDDERARGYREQALELYRQMDVPSQEELEEQLREPSSAQEDEAGPGRPHLRVVRPVAS